MKHGKSKRKFGRKTKQRQALMRHLSIALITHGKIRTTEAKAKDLRPYVERLITKARKQDTATRRSLSATLGKTTAQRLIKDVTPQFEGRNGGYTRIRHLAPRLSDGARMAVIAFVA